MRFKDYQCVQRKSICFYMLLAKYVCLVHHDAIGRFGWSEHVQPLLGNLEIGGHHSEI